MGVMMLKNISLLFLIISSSLLSTSFAGGLIFLHLTWPNNNHPTNLKRTTTIAIIIHERLLRANTKDYGNYDPAPALVKPPFKLIPN
ncbi:hypothetical protein CsSME_00009356 [Camellia sinensis var. sinensis]